MGARQFQDTTRPVNINWDCGTSTAFDITVAFPLNSMNMLEAGMCQGVSAEHRKHTEIIPIPSVLSWVGDVYRWQWRAMGPGDQKH